MHKPVTACWNGRRAAAQARPHRRELCAIGHVARGVRIGFIGAGRVARTLRARVHPCRPDRGYNRGPDAAAQLGSRVPSARPMADAQQVVDGCDMVSSRSVTTRSCRSAVPCAGNTASRGPCSSATELAALDHAKSAGAATGGFHPIQMFANPTSLEGLRGAPSASRPSPARRDLERLAASIGCGSRWRCRPACRRSTVPRPVRRPVYNRAAQGGRRALEEFWRQRSRCAACHDAAVARHSRGRARRRTGQRHGRLRGARRRWHDRQVSCGIGRRFRHRARCTANWRCATSRSGSNWRAQRAAQRDQCAAIR